MLWLGTMESKLYVSNIDEHATEKDIEQIFSQYGVIEYVSILKNSLNRKGGSAFVKYASRDMAFAAIDALHDCFVMEGCKNPLIVRFAENKKRRVESGRAESDSSYPSFGRQGSSYGLYGRMGDRNNAGGHRPPASRQPLDRRGRGTGFDVPPPMVEPLPRPRGQVNGGSWRPPHTPLHKNAAGLRGLPFNGQSFNTGQMHHQGQVYDNQQLPLKQMPHHSPHQYHQHQNQSFQSSQLHHSQRSSQHNQLPPLQPAMQRSGDTLSKFPSYAPPSSQPQWKPQTAAQQFLNQSSQAVNFAAQQIQSQSMSATPLAMNHAVLPHVAGNATYQSQSQQTLAQQPSNPTFQYQLQPQHTLQQNPANQAVQNPSVQNITQAQVPAQQPFNRPVQATNYPNPPQQLQPQTQAPQATSQTMPPSQHPQQQYQFQQQLTHMQHSASQPFVQGGSVQQNLQLHSQQTNVVPAAINTTANLSMPSINSHSDAAKSTTVSAGSHASSACDWTEHTAPDGVKYYYNKVTGVSQWDKPAELLAIEQKQMLAALQVPPQTQAQPQQSHLHPQFHTHSVHPQQLQTVQPNISKPASTFTPKPHPANTIPTVSVTNVPQATAVTVTTVSDSRASAPNHLMSDWSEHTSPEGHKYYYNRVTGASQWDKPAELVAAEQHQAQQLEVPQQIPAGK
eukprot:TRINITY_DN4200_c0_g1_i1.p1 TRINITY_DN4200_c0_g1~~TRINITY_DN4200_c0_g1_i1.p1  ORF type:complete len:676 (-),score=162.75 TRINITY_DN4200_c0_g1_i1:328-2355(-)